MRKINLAILSFFFVSMLFADTPANNKQHFDQGHAGEPHLMMPAYNTPARYDVEGSWDTYGFGSYLWWRPAQEGLGIAIKTSVSGALFPNTDGELVGMDFTYHSGFRIGFGTNLGHDNWNFEAKYAVIHTYTNVSVLATQPNVNEGTSLFPLWMGDINNQSVMGAASGEWKCDTDLFDLEMARNYYVSTVLTFRPHAGLRFMRIDQRYLARYRFLTDASTVLSKTVSYSRGIGFRAGIDTGWLLGSGFKILGNFAFSNIYTRYKVNNTQDQTATLPTFINYDVSGKYYYLRPNAEILLGLNFGTYAFENHVHFAFTVAYEHHVFWNQNMLRNFFDSVSGTTTSGQNDLYFNGLTLTTRLDF